LILVTTKSQPLTPTPVLAGSTQHVSFPGALHNPGWQAATAHQASHRRESRREILDSQLDLCCRRWHPAQNSGGTPYRQLCPAYPLANRRRVQLRRFRSPCWAKGSAGTFQRGKFPDLFDLILYTGNAFLKLYRLALAQFCETHGTQQAWINSRNLTTIATESKRRQLIFLRASVLTLSCRGTVCVCGQLCL